MMILRLSRITTSVILIILTIKHIYIYIKYRLIANLYVFLMIYQMLDIIKHSDALKLSETTKALVAQFVLRAKYSVVGSATKASKWLQ